MKHAICFLVGLCILGMTAWAGAYSVPGVSHLSSGDRMTGMEVTVNLISNGNDFYDDTAIWGLDNGIWGASGTGWSLSLPESKDTMNLDGYWTLSVGANYYISSILISGLPGNTVFDVYPQPYGVDTPLTVANLPQGVPTTVDNDIVTTPDISDTPGSEEGLVFDYTGPLGFETTVNNLWNTTAAPPVSFQYLNQVKLDSESDPFWDLYADLQIFFNSPYFVGGDNPFYFYADTDHVVPEPGTLALLGVGLLILAGAKRKFRRTL